MNSSTQKRLCVFTSDIVFAQDVSSILLLKSDVKVLVQPSMERFTKSLLLKVDGFLVDMDLKSSEFTKIIHEIHSVFEGAPNVLVATKTSFDPQLVFNIQKYNLRGYILKSNLDKMLIPRIEAFFDHKEYFRKHKRVHVSLPINYEISNYIRDKGLCTSFGEGGMFIQSTKQPPKNAPIAITIQMPKSKKTSFLKGKTLWSSPVGFAVEFSTPAHEVFSSLHTETM